jgi:hypothetical protein
MLLSLFFLLMGNDAHATAKDKKKKRKAVENAMTVAGIRPPGNDQAFTQVTFNESARFYKLPKNANPAYLDMLKESQQKKTLVIIRRASEYSDVILSVKKAM